MSNDSIVLELQRLAYRSDTNVAELCRLALIAAYKLNRQDWITWLQNELNGYNSLKDVPKYRYYFSWICRSDNNDIVSKEISKELTINFDEFPQLRWLKVYLSIPEIYAQCEMAVSLNDDNLKFLLNEMDIKILKRKLDYSNLFRIVDRRKVLNIMDFVRNRILEFALTLESEGILGHGLLFKEIEVEKATASQIFNIQNFQGTAGNVSGGVVMQENK